MASFRTSQVLLLGALLSAAPAFATRTHRAATSGHPHHRVTLHHRHVVQGQRGIDPQRATEIQNALIREHYLPGPASGEWDANTEAAMQKYQSDHGWQTKLTPDSRALIKLGLGPHTDGAQSAVGSATPASGTSAAPAVSSPAIAGTLADAHTLQN
ncbi:MAG TPA: peptidoglycan-binding domain-containing protein [Acidobacteriaceae bacterium]|nr:peptidoglycan-binding domain-containing protein [Acidobacteriaceae bacterium]